MTLISETGIAVNAYLHKLVDLNGDGNLDLVVGIISFGYYAGNLLLLAGNGDGTFQDRHMADTDTYVVSIALAYAQRGGLPVGEGPTRTVDG